MGDRKKETKRIVREVEASQDKIVSWNLKHENFKKDKLINRVEHCRESK